MGSSQSINMFAPFVTPEATQRVAQVLATPWIGQGNLVDDFEDAVKDVLCLPYAVAVNNSASAIRMALSVAGVGPGDEVITTPLTCTLTNHPILEQFAKPVFADVQKTTGNIDPTDVVKRLTSKTKAIICTHWGGLPSDLLELNQIARQNGIAVIEDASEAFGAIYQNRIIGNHSRFVAFSFHAIQSVTTGEGGMLALQSADDTGLAKMQRWYGIDRIGRHPNNLGYYDFDVKNVGFGYYMTNINAAIGIENLKSLSHQQSHREEIAGAYRKGLAEVPGLTLLKDPNDRTSSHHFFTVLVDNRDDFCRKLRDCGVNASIVHYRNDEYTVFGGLRDDLPNLDYFSQRYIGLPVHMGISVADVNHVIDVIKSGW